MIHAKEKDIDWAKTEYTLKKADYIAVCYFPLTNMFSEADLEMIRDIMLNKECKLSDYNVDGLVIINQTCTEEQLSYTYKALVFIPSDSTFDTSLIRIKHEVYHV